jgi:hypothetical protein
MEMRGQGETYSCSFEMARLAAIIGGISDIPDKEIAEAIKLTPSGADPWDLLMVYVNLVSLVWLARAVPQRTSC